MIREQTPLRSLDSAGNRKALRVPIWALRLYPSAGVPEQGICQYRGYRRTERLQGGLGAVTNCKCCQTLSGFGTIQIIPGDLERPKTIRLRHSCPPRPGNTRKGRARLVNKDNELTPLGHACLRLQPCHAAASHFRTLSRWSTSRLTIGSTRICRLLGGDRTIPAVPFSSG